MKCFTDNYNDLFKNVLIFDNNYNGLPASNKTNINHRTFKKNIE